MKAKRILKNTVVTLLLPALAFSVSIIVHDVFSAEASIHAIFVLAVFLVSLFTDSYIYGIAATLVSVFAVNFAFTFPYFKFNFTIPENAVSAVIMLIVALVTCTLTTQIKRQESIKTESERERTRANLLRAVSHDLRTPLTSIYGASCALIENKSDFTELQTDRMLQGIKDDSQWLIRMVENLLSITRLDSNGVTIIKTPTVLDELIDSVLVKFRKRYPKQDVTLDLPADLVIVPMDAILIEQVLVNILDNAVEHAKGMSTLTLRVLLEGHKAVFEIEDDGCGIDQSRIKGIFSGYNMTTGAPSDGRRRNAGIGLSVCATIIKAHGSEIKVENTSKGGAKFSFALNIEDSQYAQQQQ